MSYKKDRYKTINDVIAMQGKTTKHTNAYQGPDALRIINAYLEIVKESLLAGFTFLIPNIGTFEIQKKKAEKKVSIKQSITQLKTVYQKQQEPGYKHEVVFTASEKVDTKIYKFITVPLFYKQIISQVQSGKQYVSYGN